METKDILKALRKAKGYTSMSEFCNDTGMNFSTYQNYEAGKRTPTADILIKLADFFGVTVDYLLGRANPPDPMAQLASLTSMELTEQVILERYLELPKASRGAVMSFMKSAIAEAEKRAEEEKPPIQVRQGQEQAIARTSDPTKKYRPAPTKEQMKSFKILTPEDFGEK